MMTITAMTMTGTRFFRQQPTLVGCIPGRGVVGDFYDDDKDEYDGDGNVNEEDHCPVLSLSEDATNAVNGDADSEDNNDNLIL